MNSGDPWQQPDARRWLQHVRRDLVPMIEQSAYVMSLIPSGETDVKFAVELGLSIMLDKPIIGVVTAGATVPPKLAAVIDAWIEWTDDPTVMSQRITEATTRIGKP